MTADELRAQIDRLCLASDKAQIDRLASDKARLAMEAKELALELDEWKEALKASEGRATAWGTAANERAARIATLEKALREAIDYIEETAPCGPYVNDWLAALDGPAQAKEDK